MARHSLLPWGAGPSFCGFVTQLSFGPQIAYELAVANLTRIERNDATISFVSGTVLRMNPRVLVGTDWGGLFAWQ
jgi:hypothetical protein